MKKKKRTLTTVTETIWIEFYYQYTSLKVFWLKDFKKSFPVLGGIVVVFDAKEPYGKVNEEKIL